MSFPSRSVVDNRTPGRVRASSFNHTTVIRKQHSDSFFNSPLSKHEATITRRPSFDTHQRQQQQRQSIIQHGNTGTTFLAVNVAHNGASSIDESASDDDLSIPVAPITTHQLDQKQFIGKPRT